MSILDIIGNDIGEPIMGSQSSGVVKSESGRRIFIKSGVPSKTYQCEANGLRELSKSGKIAVAEVVSVGDNFIATEYIEQGNTPHGFFDDFGRQFAQMHRTVDDNFGFYQDNFIGHTPQSNIPSGKQSTDWAEFYYNKRLLYQYRLAESNNYITKSTAKNFARLESIVKKLFKGSEEPPTLLHGDLWRGNFICNKQGQAVLIDPAVYYGHREADLAMTRLFGGFSAQFYEAYNREYPLPSGWRERVDIYKLYHIMNHLNLFGRGYLGETEAIIAHYAK